VLVLVLVLDLSDFGAEKRAHHSDREISTILEHEHDDEHEHDSPNFGIWCYCTKSRVLLEALGIKWIPEAE